MQEMYERKNYKVKMKAGVDKISSRSRLPWLRRSLNRALTPPRDGGFTLVKIKKAQKELAEVA